jgi:hypothetical protein
MHPSLTEQSRQGQQLSQTPRRKPALEATVLIQYLMLIQSNLMYVKFDINYLFLAYLFQDNFTRKLFSNIWELPEE